MKKKLSIFLMLLLTSLYAETRSHLQINHTPLLLVEEEYDEYDSKGKTLTFYRDENRTQEKKDEKSVALFSLVLQDATGGCNDKSIEKGVYEVNGSIVTLYSFWKRQGSVDDAPYGARVTVYEFLKDGKVEERSSLLYVEEHTEDSNPESGMQFLFKEPKTKEESEQFATYVARVEKNFNGRFVFKEEATKLMKEVRGALKRELKAKWRR
jgi:hypothetical protein